MFRCGFWPQEECLEPFEAAFELEGWEKETTFHKDHFLTNLQLMPRKSDSLDQQPLEINLPAKFNSDQPSIFRLKSVHALIILF